MTDRDATPDRLHGVIVGCASDDGRLLMVRRSLHVSRAPGTVCFPGGTVERGENQPQTVVREMREELGVSVEPIRCIWRCSLLDRPWTLWGWLAKLDTDQILHPDPAEVAEAFWLTPEEGYAHHEGLPTNGPFIQALLKALHWERD